MIGFEQFGTYNWMGLALGAALTVYAVTLVVRAKTKRKPLKLVTATVATVFAVSLLSYAFQFSAVPSGIRQLGGSVVELLFAIGED